MRIYVRFDVRDYDVYPVSDRVVTLTEREIAIIASFLPVIGTRQVWEPISDSDWQAVNDQIESIWLQVNERV